MTRERFMNDFWNYYLLLEKKFTAAIQYVELSDNNYDTHSIEFVNQLQSLGSETDVVFKEMCGFISSDRKTISDYAPIILRDYPNIIGQKIKIVGKNIIITPFEGWDISRPSQSLFWWEKYNNVKHGRVANYRDANLKCTLFLLSGIFTLENYWLKKIVNGTSEMDIPDRESELFQMMDWQTRYISGNDMMLELVDN